MSGDAKITFHGDDMTVMVNVINNRPAREAAEKILAWHKAELERYGEKVRDECREWVKFHALKNDDGRLTVGAGVLNLMPLPPIDREGASREPPG